MVQVKAGDTHNFQFTDRFPGGLLVKSSNPMLVGASPYTEVRTKFWAVLHIYFRRHQRHRFWATSAAPILGHISGTVFDPLPARPAAALCGPRLVVWHRLPGRFAVCPAGLWPRLGVAALRCDCHYRAVGGRLTTPLFLRLALRPCSALAFWRSLSA